MGDMSAAGTAPTVEGGASLLPTTFTSLIDFGHAVDKLALSQNKNVSVDPKASGSRGRVYRCKHWIAARKKHTMTVEKAAKETRQWCCAPTACGAAGQEDVQVPRVRRDDVPVQVCDRTRHQARAPAESVRPGQRARVVQHSGR
eukprot:m.405286 g.405286  ORF g.405286 m.405286 type:complete len:144 (-) comp16794_c3_seq53:594-1025(-)